MTPLFHFQTGGPFNSSLITSFLVFTCTAYNFFFWFVVMKCIPRTLYPVKHTGNCSAHPVHPLSVPWSSVETCRCSTDCVPGLPCAVEAGIGETGQLAILNLVALLRFLCKNQQGSIFLGNKSMSGSVVFENSCAGQQLPITKVYVLNDGRQLCL